MTPRRAGLLALLWAGFCLAQSPPPAVEIRLEGDPLVFRVYNSAFLRRLNNPNLEAIFTVRLAREGAPPLAGSHRLDNGILTFEPRHPLEPGLSYRAEFRLATEKAARDLEAPKPVVVSTTEVERVYPSSAIVPENLLKFYIHFSAPMSRGVAVKYLHLFEDDKVEVKLPFLELAEELWDREQKRLTVLFDPGRIKRGVTPNQEVGMALKSGKSYSLAIDPAWPDAQGIPLKSGFKKFFAVMGVERTPIEPSKWQIQVPEPGSTGPLTVDFPAPLDAALLPRLLEVLDPAGAPVAGQVVIENVEKRWMFRPSAAWAAGEYKIDILPGLEDLAGNKVGRAFDVDTFDTVAAAPESNSVKFTVGSSPAPSVPTPK